MSMIGKGIGRIRTVRRRVRLDGFRVEAKRAFSEAPLLRRRRLTFTRQARIEMVAAAVPQSRIMIETALIRVFRAVVLAGPERGVSGCSQHLAKRDGVDNLRIRPRHAALLGVNARQQAGPGRKAFRRIMDSRKPHAFGGEAIKIRGFDFASKATHVAEPHVVDQDEQDVGTGRCAVAQSHSWEADQ